MDEAFSGSTSPSLSAHARRAEIIVGKPGSYKICEGCDSIVPRRVAICPDCSGYRFNTGRKAVIDQARILKAAASRPA